MAGDWIKVRSSLLQAPELWAITCHLGQDEEFRAWLGLNGQPLSKPASRAVTLASLVLLWGACREHGHFDGDDLIIDPGYADTLDHMAGVPGIGEALARVGWALLDTPPGCITLPNFKRYNVPLSEAERSSRYRRRQKGRTVTEPSRAVTQRHAPSRSREEKSRQEVLPSVVPRSAPEAGRCGALTASGVPCKNPAGPEGRCHAHGDTPPASAHQAAVRLWCDLWLEHRGTPWVMDGPKDGSAMARVLKKAGGDLELIRARIERLLVNPPATWDAQNAAPWLLASKWNELGVEIVTVLSFDERRRKAQDDLLDRRIRGDEQT